MTDERLTAAQIVALRILVGLGNEWAYTSNTNDAACKAIHTGSGAALEARGLAEVRYERSYTTARYRATEAGRRRLARIDITIANETIANDPVERARRAAGGYTGEQADIINATGA